MKKIAWGSAERAFLKPFFPIQESFFSKFPHKLFVIILPDIIQQIIIKNCIELHFSQPIRIDVIF